jgi:hypothetical protein
MLRLLTLLVLVCGLSASVDAAAQSAPPAAQASPVQGEAAPPVPAGDAPTVTFNATGVYEPRDLERISIDVPRDGSLYLTFLRRFTVTGGAASRNMEMDFTFSSITLKHSGATPGNANITVRTIDGRTLFIAARSLPRPGDDRFAYIR